MESGQEIFRALGMSLIHSLWQGALIAALVHFMLLITGKSDSNVRYGIYFTGLLVLLVSFVTTFIILYPNNQDLSIIRPLYPANTTNLLPVSQNIFQKIPALIDPYSIYIAFGWILGFVITGIRMTGGALFAHFSIRRNLVQPDYALNDLFIYLRHSMGLSDKIELRISHRMISPLVCGVIAPLVIIPAAALTGLSTEQLRAVMIHELAHIRRYDHILVLVQAMARLILFFHPLAWILMSGIDRERENCCDDLVIRKNNNPINYIKALAMIQEMNLTGTTANALTGKSNHLLNRIRRLIRPETKHSPTFRLSVILLSAAAIAISTMAFIITENPDIKSMLRSDSGVVRMEPAGDSPQLQGISGTYEVDDKDGDKKKKMVIVFDNDTIKEMTVNGKKLSKEEMKEYADEIRKVQQELGYSRDELERAHERLAEAQRELENAQREFELANRNSEFNFDFNTGDLKLLNELNDLNYLNHSDELRELNDLNLDMNKLNELMNEFNIHNFQFEQPDQPFQSQEFQEKMKQAQEQAMEAFRQARQKSLEYMNSEEFREKMKKAQEEAMKAFEEAKKMNKEFFDSEEFREQMRKASEDARKAFEELRKSGFNNNYNYDFFLHQPPAPGIPPHEFQEPPSPRPDAEKEIEAPEPPEPPEAPEVEVETEMNENLEIEEVPEAEHQEQLEIEEEHEENPRSEEINNTLKELENE